MSDQIKKGWAREFFQAPNEIYDRHDIDGHGKAVFVYLCRRADAEGQAFPTYDRIASDVGFSKRTVRRAIQGLIGVGLLLKERRYDGRGMQTSNLYTLIRPSTVPERRANDLTSSVKGQDTGDVEVAPGLSGQELVGERSGYSKVTGRVACEATEEYPDDQYPGEEEDLSVSLSFYHPGVSPARKILIDGRIDFSDQAQVFRYCGERFGADERQVRMAMLSVQGQLEIRDL